MTRKSATSATELEAQIRGLIQDGKLHEAAAACDVLNRDFPEHASGWYTASQVALQVDEPGIALRAIDAALRLSPGKPEWLLRKLVCLAKLGDEQTATNVARELQDLEFENVVHASNCGLALNRLGLHEAAERHFRRAIQLEPDNGTHYFNLATVLRFLGRLDEARISLDLAIELDPADYEAYLLRSGLRTQTSDDNNVDSIKAALSRVPEKHPGRIRLCYALAKELEDLEEYDKSFDYLDRASRARRESMSYTPDRDLDTIRAICEQYRADAFEGAEQGFVNAEPIFILGMPRTGTTLVDRILGAHSCVRSAGELPTFGAQLTIQCERIASREPKAPAELVPLTRQLDFAALGEAYVVNARPKNESSAHFIDKLPLNYLYTGIIHLALPKAKIICLRRDPMDTVYAVYKTLFQSAYPYSYDLQELATYFVAYRQLMAHWQEVLPDVVHTVQYEDLVTDPRPVIEALLDYCDLSWEDTCLKFHESGGAVTTASAAQVRQAMHTRSIGIWRHYESHLRPAMEIIREAGVYE